MGNHQSPPESNYRPPQTAHISCDGGVSDCQRKAFETCTNRSNYDPVISRRQNDRTGPNPDPTYCYLQKTMSCQNFKSQ